VKKAVFVHYYPMEETNEPATAVAANGVSNTSATTAWFEFILDETLLERHLSEPNAGERWHTNLFILRNIRVARNLHVCVI